MIVNTNVVKIVLHVFFLKWLFVSVHLSSRLYSAFFDT